MEPEKPFACTFIDCGMTFTNEDHLHVHTKKHDMVLQLGIEQKAAFVADQTPTPTRFIRNCEEVGLFQDLQNVNPFDEGFKRAMETKYGILSLEGANGLSSTDDVLHTPHLVFPLIDTGDCALFSTTNNQRNITISRSSSDESGAIKEYETTTISKLTNEVTTISRVVGKQDVLDRITATDDVSVVTTDDVSIVRHEETARNKETINETSVSYTNNIIIHSNVEIRKDSNIFNTENSKSNQIPVTTISYADSVIQDATNVVTSDVMLTDSNTLHVPQAKVAPIMSQKSLDFVVDSLTTDTSNELTVDRNKEQSLKTLKRNYDTVLNKNKALLSEKPSVIVNNINKVTNNKDNKTELNDLKDNDYEVIIKFPNGKHVKMKAVEESSSSDKIVHNKTKEKLKKVLIDKVKEKSQSKSPTFQKISGIQNAQIVPNILPIPTGTLIPIAILSPPSAISQSNPLQNISLIPINTVNVKKPVDFKAVKKKPQISTTSKNSDTSSNLGEESAVPTSQIRRDDSHKTDHECVIADNNVKAQSSKKWLRSKQLMESRSAASKRYRERLKETMRLQSEENRRLRESNQRLIAEQAHLKFMITQHLKKCPMGDDLRNIREKLQKPKTTTNV